ANSLSLAEVSILRDKIIEILKLAIESGGSSLRDYRKADGEKGGFQELFLVYGKKGHACKTCGSLIDRIVQSGRSSFFCPNCQK
ncbi:MAG: DNA-formamidopyrimidine glycosylase, partial [Alphaproteobacteria bacterium]|nr:DNA-formamidopyrimidine glycosylase [Alphaproteobacteria bacterium]